MELLAEEFLERRRRGERPTVAEYAARHPELAAAIRDLFPALLLMENLGEGSLGGPAGTVDQRRPRRAGPGPCPDRSRSSWATTASSARSAEAAWASSTRPSRGRSAAAWP